MRLTWLALLLLALAGCASGPSLTNTPLSAHPSVYLATPRLLLQVDQNGDFYPDGWNIVPGEDAVDRTGSLALASGPAGAGAVAASRAQALSLVREATRGKRRVFILIHGFNADAAAAEAGYGVLERSLLFKPDDAVIEFNWDGLADRGQYLNAGRIWFPAVATSQLAGSRGLRAVLGELHDTRVIFITHSRGASVVLSAVSNPAYTPDFTSAIAGLGFADDFLTPAPLDAPTRHLRMDVVMLAPAIGNPDFWAPACSGQSGCRNFRAFPGLDSIRHSLNPADPVLRKSFFAWNPLTLGCRFNATTLGYTEACGSWVRDHYNTGGQVWLKAFSMTPMPSHSFVCYAGHPVLRRMLAELDVETRPVQGDDAPPPRRCLER